MEEDLDFSPDEDPDKEQNEIPWIGILFRDSYQEMAYRLPASNEAPMSYGPLVVRVDETGPAARAGLVAGDLILKVDGEQITSAQLLCSNIRNRSVGDVIMLLLNRDGTQIEVKILIEDGWFNLHHAG